MIYIRIYLAIILLAAHSSQATEDCESPYTTAAMVYCASHDFREADDELNLVYKELLSTLDSEGQQKLSNSQRAWLKFRDTHGEFASDIWRNGSQQPVIYFNAITDMTIERAKELQKELQQRNDNTKDP